MILEEYYNQSSSALDEASFWHMDEFQPNYDGTKWTHYDTVYEGNSSNSGGGGGGGGNDDGSCCGTICMCGGCICLLLNPDCICGAVSNIIEALCDCICS